MEKIKKSRIPSTGRPPKNIVRPIHDTPENVAKALMQSAPRKKWDYLKKK